MRGKGSVEPSPSLPPPSPPPHLPLFPLLLGGRGKEEGRGGTLPHLSHTPSPPLGFPPPRASVTLPLSSTPGFRHPSRIFGFPKGFPLPS